MAITAAELMVRFGAQGVAETGRAIDDVGKKVEDTRRRTAAGGLALVGFAGAIVGGLALATREAIGFDAAMQNVNSIAQLSTAEIDAIGDSVLALASTTAQAPQVLAAGLYDIYSSGFQGAEALTVLEVAANAATAGLTTTDVSARAVVGALNAFHLEADQAERIANVLFQTVNEGVITFDELANNLGNTMPLANALGISIEELGAAYAQMTLSGVGASQAETQIAALMRSTINPTEALTAAIQAQGYASVEAMIATEGMAGFLTFLATTSGGSNEALFDLLGTTEAVNAALILGANGGADYAASVERMGEASEGAGAMSKALEKQMQSAAFQIQKAKVALLQAAVVIGKTFLPAVTFVAKGITSLIGKFLDLPDPIKRTAAIVATAAAGFLAVVGVLAMVAAGVGPLAVGVGVLGAAIGLLLSPIALVVLALGGLVILFRNQIGDAVGAAGDAFADFGRYVGAVLDDGDVLNDWLTHLPGFVQPVAEAIGRAIVAFRDLAGGIGGFMDTLRTVGFDEAVGVLAASIQNAFGNETLTRAVVNGVQFVHDLFTGEWGKAWENLTAFFADVGTLTIGATLALADTIWEGAGNLWGWFTRAIGADALVQGDASGGPGMDRPIGVGTVLVEGFFRLVDDIWDGAKGLWGWFERAIGVGDLVGGDASGGPEMDRRVGLGDVIVDMGEWVLGKIADLWGWVTGVASDAWDLVKTGAAAALDVTIDVASWVKGQWPDVHDWVQEQVQSEWDGKQGAPITLDVGGSPFAVKGVPAWFFPPMWPVLAFEALASKLLGFVEGKSFEIDLSEAPFTVKGVPVFLIPPLWPVLLGIGIFEAVQSGLVGVEFNLDLADTVANILTVPALVIPVFWPIVLTLKLADEIRDAMKGKSIGFDMGNIDLRVLGIPFILIPAAWPIILALAIWQKLKDINLPDLSWPNALKINFPDLDFPDLSWENFSGAGGPIGTAIAAIGELTEDWPDALKISFPNIDFPDLSLSNIKDKVVAWLKDLGDLDVGWPNSFSIRFGGDDDSNSGFAPPDVTRGGGGGGGEWIPLGQAGLAGIVPSVLDAIAAIAQLENEGTKHLQNLTKSFGETDATSTSSLMRMAAAATNITLGIESRLQGFASAATQWGINASDGWSNPLRIGFAAAAAVVTNITLGLEGRLSGFAGAATVAGFNAGDGWFAGTSQGFRQAESAGRAHVAALHGILAIDLGPDGYRAGRSYGDSVARGLRDSLAGVQAAGAAIRNAAAGAVNATLAELNRGAELASGFNGTGV